MTNQPEDNAAFRIALGLYAAEITEFLAEELTQDDFVSYDEADNPFYRMPPVDLTGENYDNFIALTKKAGRPFKFEGVLHPEKVLSVHPGSPAEIEKYTKIEGLYPEDLQLIAEFEIDPKDSQRLYEKMNGLWFNLVFRKEEVGFDVYAVHAMPLGIGAVNEEIIHKHMQTFTLIVRHQFN
jgi:hypothetical protein